MKPVVLLIRDGWGIRDEKRGNAIKQAKTHHIDRFLKQYPHAVLQASGPAVGLPEGYQGNSEVGHLTIGSGRIIYQSLLRITNAIEDGSFKRKKAFTKLMAALAKRNRSLHLMGLVQDQGVHAHIDHLIALLELAKKKKVPRVKIHVFTDGRDTPPTSAAEYITRLTKACNRIGIGEIVSLIGRYYAMDRDNRWVRTELAYRAIVHGIGRRFSDWHSALDDAYHHRQTDEFIRPRIIEGYDGIKQDDGVIFFNYRFDRARQLTKALVEDDFDVFHRDLPRFDMVAMTEYYDDMNCDVAFGPIVLQNMLGQTVSRRGMKQLRISETEKYAHVTFFFNGLEETPSKGEDRIIIHSPHVATYDQKPEMSVYKITDRLEKEMDSAQYDLIIVNLVNGDMVGHTGIIAAAKHAVTAVDECVGRIAQKTLAKGGVCLITADHGNCEEMIGRHKTSHTLNPVDLIVVSKEKCALTHSEGTLADLAPTILKLLKVKKPKEMSGKSLI